MNYRLDDLVHVVRFYDSPDLDGVFWCDLRFCVREVRHLRRSSEYIVDPTEDVVTCLWCVAERPR